HRHVRESLNFRIACRALYLTAVAPYVTTPYGYGGPVAIGESPPVARFYELYEGWCRERGIVTTFIRFHPLLANHLQARAPVHVEPLGPTIGWRLDAPADLVALTHSKHRNKVRRAQ